MNKEFQFQCSPVPGPNTWDRDTKWVRPLTSKFNPVQLKECFLTEILLEAEVVIQGLCKEGKYVTDESAIEYQKFLYWSYLGF